MLSDTFKSTARYLTALVVVAVFIFPIAWFALTSVKPISAVFNKDRVVVFDFKPTLENYRVTVFGGLRSDKKSDSSVLMGTSGTGAYDGRGSIVSSLIIAVSSTSVSYTHLTLPTKA